MELFDTHCHVHFKDYPIAADKMWQAAKAAGVARLICVGTSLDDSAKAVEFAGAYDDAWASVGEHPHDGHDFLKSKDALVRFNQLLAQPKVVAVGEIGLDYYHDHTPWLEQEKVLRLQIETSLDAGLPYIFHVRDAFKDFWRIFDEYKIKRAVVHSFSAGTKTLNKILERDLMVGLNGIMTFTRDHAQLEAAKQTPLNKLVLETDAPFLTPKAFTGQTCEPKHIRTIAEFLAELRGESLEELAAATTANANNLFGLKNG